MENLSADSDECKPRLAVAECVFSGVAADVSSAVEANVSPGGFRVQFLPRELLRRSFGRRDARPLRQAGRAALRAGVSFIISPL
jgi:hypothetical protein